MTNKYDNFTDIPFITNNLDRYFIRTSIFNFIKKSLTYFKGSLLDVGCGQMPYRKYIFENSQIETYTGLDIDTAIEYNKDIRPDYTWDGKTIPFSNESYDTLIATEVLEHCPYPAEILQEMKRVLKKDGYIFLSMPFLWPLHETPHDEYRYTPFAVKRLFEEAGFRDIKIYAGGGWHASMAQMLGLWVRRSGLSAKKKKYLSVILKPIIKYLLKKDKPPTNFHEGLMITNLFVQAIK
ncbi:SAM-dependent methyltransferase [Dysgonomonas hofstadii]|uniref:SAM-dependent methyltransferase n=1 Tax=Dysgonomonas hofstadii TaxID=637886 RepID=A0A840CIQ7_9BACT|nr:class I SAM-dependent methyltransferase [Dysgonomonas hofstadii]MBB4035071.1 SAM-dependent methyltransferase [Dysgonomonas hofstadii]